MSATVPLPDAPEVSDLSVTRQANGFTTMLRASAAGALLVVFVVLLGFGSGFPSNAPIEQLFLAMMAISVLGGSIAFIPLAVRAASTSVRVAKRGRTGRLSIAALPLTVVPLLLWVPLALVPTLIAAAAGSRARYMTETGILALLSGALVLGIVFAVVALRQGGRRTAVFSALSLVCGAVLVAAMVVPTVLYGVGLTD